MHEHSPLIGNQCYKTTGPNRSSTVTSTIPRLQVEPDLEHACLTSKKATYLEYRTGDEYSNSKVQSRYLEAFPDPRSTLRGLRGTCKS